MPDAPAHLGPVITRRAGLRALALIGPIGVLAACTDDGAPIPGPSATATQEPPPAEASAADEAALIAQYDTVLGAFPEADADVLAALAAIRDQHVQHRDALGGAEPQTDPSAPPVGVRAAITALIAAERQAGKARIRACVAAENPEVARLLALIAASESAHVPALRDVRP
jgi:hypothetical protein